MMFPWLYLDAFVTSEIARENMGAAIPNRRPVAVPMNSRSSSFILTVNPGPTRMNLSPLVVQV
jgi:hypothetical protein